MEPSALRQAQCDSQVAKVTVHPALFGLCLAAGCQELKQQYGSEHGGMERMRSG